MKRNLLAVSAIGGFILASAVLLLWPNNDRVINQEFDTASVFGVYIENPLHCEELLAVNALQTYRIDDGILHVGNARLSGQWTPLNINSREVISIINSQSNDCPPFNGITLGNFIPLTFKAPNGDYSFLFELDNEILFLRAPDSDWRTVTKFNMDKLSKLPIDVSYGSEEVLGLDERDDDENLDTDYGYDLRADIEFYDDPDFFEQFKESEKLLKDFDRFQRLSGEVQIDDLSGNQ